MNTQLLYATAMTFFFVGACVYGTFIGDTETIRAGMALVLVGALAAMLASRLSPGRGKPGPGRQPVPSGRSVGRAALVFVVGVVLSGGLLRVREHEALLAGQAFLLVIASTIPLVLFASQHNSDRFPGVYRAIGIQRYWPTMFIVVGLVFLARGLLA